MRNDHKREQPRKEQQRHQTNNVSFSKNRRSESEKQSRQRNENETKEIKGKDIDLMNYTDI